MAIYEVEQKEQRDETSVIRDKSTCQAESETKSMLLKSKCTSLKKFKAKQSVNSVISSVEKTERRSSSRKTRSGDKR